jgi:hypothetical protein
MKMPFYSADIEVEPRKYVTVFSCLLGSSAYSTARKSLREDSNWWNGISLYKRNYKIGKCLRDYEAKRLVHIVDSVSNIRHYPVIIAGDLNDWSGNDCLDILQYTSS